MLQPLFRDRHDAGLKLAHALSTFTGASNLLVLGLPRGGVPVAYEVAQFLDAQLDIFMVRKLGVPGHEELAIGAIATGDVVVWNQEVLDEVRPSRAELDAVIQREHKELERRDIAYRGDRPHPEISGHTVILIDDGLATGASMRAAAEALRQQQPTRLIVAVPVAAPETCAEFQNLVDDVVCAATPQPFIAVGIWYGNFSPTTDEEVRDLLQRAGSRNRQGASR